MASKTIQQLIADRTTFQKSILFIQFAQQLGLKELGGFDLTTALRDNRRTVKLINNELARRTVKI